MNSRELVQSRAELLSSEWIILVYTMITMKPALLSLSLRPPPPLCTLRMTLRRTTLVVTFSSSSDTPSTSPSSRSSWPCMYLSTERTEPLAMWRMFWQLMTRKASRMKLKRSSVTRAHISARCHQLGNSAKLQQQAHRSFRGSCCPAPLSDEAAASLSLVHMQFFCLSLHVRLCCVCGPLPWVLFLPLSTLRSGMST